MVIYADVIFAINFFMDAFILWISARLLNLRVRVLRVILSSAAGALIYTLLLCYNAGINNFLLSELLIALNVALCFLPKTAAEFAGRLAIVNISSFAVGGICVVLLSFTGTEAFAGTIKLNTGNYTLKLLIFSCAISYIAIKLFMAKLHSRVISKQMHYALDIYIGGKTAKAYALVDTGCTLKEPVTGLPVIVADISVLKPLLPEGFENEYLGKEVRFEHLMNIEGTIFENRLRLIPYNGLGTKNGLLLGIRPDKVELKDEKQSFCVTDTVVGIYCGKLSENGYYQALVSPELLLESRICEPKETKVNTD